MKRISVLTILLMLFFIAPASAQETESQFATQDFFNDFFESGVKNGKQIGGLVIATAFRSAVIGYLHGLAVADQEERYSDEILVVCVSAIKGDSAEIIEQFRVWLLDNAEYMQKDIFLAIAVHAEHRCAANMLEEIEKQRAE